jgi:hypothetical protein
MNPNTLFLNNINYLEAGAISASNKGFTLEEVVDSVSKGQEKLLSVSITDIIHFFSKVASFWAEPNSEIQKKYQRHGINFLIYWMREKSLRELTKVSLRGNHLCLDEFTELPYAMGMFLANPRGIICHWLAGNVPIIGMLSLIQSILTKNANILKVSSKSPHVLPELLASMKDVEIISTSGRKISGKDILDSVAAIYFSSSNACLQSAFSKVADVRVAWGQKSSVEAVMNTKKNVGTEDIIFGPKTSFMVIGHEVLESEVQAMKIAKKAAIDASVFEQQGCNSPHTIFVEQGACVSPQHFARLLSYEMDNALVRYPKESNAAGDVINILTLRAEYDIYGEAYYPKSMAWTVLYSDDDKGLATPYYNRTVFVRPVKDIFDIVGCCSHQTQTAGVALSEERKIAFAMQASRNGIDRVPNIGSMTSHDVPWDGLFMMDRLVRWCKVS